MSIKKILGKLLTEKELRETIVQRVISIAKQTKSVTDFLDALVYDYGFNIKDGDLSEIGIDDLESATSFWHEYHGGNVWKEYPDRIENINVADTSIGDIDIKYSNSISGEAKVQRNTIYLSDKFISIIERFGDTSDEVMGILYHEIGHILYENNTDIADWVTKNPEGALGKYNVSKGYWDGISYNPSESWAQAFSIYYIRPSDLRSNFPKAYEFVKKIVNQINIDNLIDDVMVEYDIFLDRWVFN